MVVDMIRDLPYADDHSTKAGGLFGVEKVKPDPWNLAVNTGVGKLIDAHWSINSPRGDFFYTSDAGGLFGVEKVKPDPWNLAVNTGVGKLMDPLRTNISLRGDFFIYKRCGGTLRS